MPWKKLPKPKPDPRDVYVPPGHSLPWYPSGKTKRPNRQPKTLSKAMRDLLAIQCPGNPWGLNWAQCLAIAAFVRGVEGDIQAIREIRKTSEPMLEREPQGDWQEELRELGLDPEEMEHKMRHYLFAELEAKQNGVNGRLGLPNGSNAPGHPDG